MFQRSALAHSPALILQPANVLSRDFHAGRALSRRRLPRRQLTKKVKHPNSQYLLASGSRRPKTKRGLTNAKRVLDDKMLEKLADDLLAELGNKLHVDGERIHFGKGGGDIDGEKGAASIESMEDNMLEEFSHTHKHFIPIWLSTKRTTRVAFGLMLHFPRIGLKLDVEEFVTGATQAFSVIVQKMYDHDFGNLDSMMSEDMEKAIVESMEQYKENGITFADVENIHVNSCKIVGVDLLEPDLEGMDSDDEDDSEGSTWASVTVVFDVEEAFTMNDADGGTILGTDKPRKKEHVWEFMGLVKDGEVTDWRFTNVKDVKDYYGPMYRVLGFFRSIFGK